jgi:serine/threonine protein kinase
MPVFHPVLRESPINEDACRAMFRQIMSGVDFLHSVGVAHRDISLENILLDAEGEVKISDYGVACTLVPTLPGSVDRPGKTVYMSPGTAMHSLRIQLCIWIFCVMHSN